MNRILQVMRLQRPAWPQMAGWPWGMMAASFGIALLIFGAIHDQIDGPTTTGGLASLYGVAVGMAAVSVTQVFPYALGMSVTRREFYLAWSLLAVAQSVAYALVLSVLHAVEQATDDWGVGLRFFGPPFLDDVNPALRLLVYTASMLLATHLGILFGTVYLRWGTTGVVASFGLAIIGFGLVAALITWTRQWNAIGRWLLDQSPTALFAGWPVLVAAAFALGGYTLIRRATTLG
jgi:hypothetical protein